MDEETRQSILQLLGKAMSDLSEEAYCGRWVGGTEYIVPELCRRAMATGTVQRSGRWEVTPEVARGLTFLSDQLGHWATLADDGNGYVQHHPFPLSSDHSAIIDYERPV